MSTIQQFIRKDNRYHHILYSTTILTTNTQTLKKYDAQTSRLKYWTAQPTPTSNKQTSKKCDAQIRNNQGPIKNTT